MMTSQPIAWIAICPGVFVCVYYLSVCVCVDMCMHMCATYILCMLCTLSTQ